MSTPAPGKKPDFVYVTYIVSTPEKVWQALTDPAITPQYWFHRRNVSDWKPGSEWRHQDVEADNRDDLIGKVLESDPPHRLVLSWGNAGEKWRQSKPSKVTIEIKPMQDSVRLTIIHDELEPDSPMHRGITHGWPAVMASLKSFLETGKQLPSMRQIEKEPH